MAYTETKCKASLVGIWRDVTLTDELAKNIAARATAEKGKRVLVVLRKEGITLIRAKLFKDNVTEFYSMETLGRVDRNSRNTRCLMFEVRDLKQFKIVAVRCNSEADAIHLVSMFRNLRQDSQLTSNVELKKKDTSRRGTLRERSVVNANKHMAEIFKENQDAGLPMTNGDIHHVPVLDRSNHVDSNNTQTEIQVVEARYIEENGDVISKRDDEIIGSHSRAVTTEVSPNFLRHQNSTSPIIYATCRTILPSRPVIVSRPGSRRPSQQSITRVPVVYRVSEKHKGEKMYVADPWASHRRFSGDFVLQKKVADQLQSTAPDSGRNSLRVKFDTESITSSNTQRSTSLRERPKPIITSVSTTVPRSIEDTYGRSGIVRRRGSGDAYVISKQRPSSIHVMRGNDLKVHQPVHQEDVFL